MDSLGQDLSKVVEVTFSELLNVLYEFLGTGQKSASFVSDFICLLMGEPDSFGGARTYDDFYPYFMHSDSYTDPHYNICNKLFNGSSELSQANASKILHRYRKNREGLIDCICELEDEQKDELQRKLIVFGIPFEGANFAETIADVVDLILNSYSLSGRGYDFSSLPTRTLSGNSLQGVPIQSVVIHDGKLIVGGIQIDLPRRLDVPDVVDMDLEEKYVNAILEAIVDASSEKTPITIDEIEKLKPHLRKMFIAQRKNFYDAEYLRRFAREILPDGDNQFELLEDDVEAGVEPVLFNNNGNGLERMNAVLEKSAEIQLTRSDLCNVKNAIGTRTRFGLCHELVNDGKIDSWVKHDE